MPSSWGTIFILQVAKAGGASAPKNGKTRRDSPLGDWSVAVVRGSASRAGAIAIGDRPSGCGPKYVNTSRVYTPAP